MEEKQKWSGDCCLQTKLNRPIPIERYQVNVQPNYVVVSAFMFCLLSSTMCSNLCAFLLYLGCCLFLVCCCYCCFYFRNNHSRVMGKDKTIMTWLARVFPRVSCNFSSRLFRDFTRAFRDRFPAVDASCLVLLWILIGTFCAICTRSDWLAISDRSWCDAMQSFENCSNFSSTTLSCLRMPD